MIVRRSLMMILVFVVSVFLLNTIASAENYHGIPIENTRILPEGSFAEVSDSCSGHPKILYANAREDGWFITTSFITTEKADNREGITFGVDIYDANGNFCKELVFSTPQSILTEITSEGVNIYFYDHVITYDIRSGEFVCNDYPGGYLYESDWTNNLTKRKFSVGEWDYSFSPIVPWGNPSTLIRTNDQERQVLVSFSNPFQDIFSIAAPIIAILLGISILVFRRKKKQISSTEKNNHSEFLE